MTDLEKLKNELWNVITSATAGKRWLCLAKHVQSIILEARIKDLTWSLNPRENPPATDDPYWLIEQRIAELKRQLEG